MYDTAIIVHARMPRSAERIKIIMHGWPLINSDALVHPTNYKRFVLCFLLLWLGSNWIYSYPSGLFHLHPTIPDPKYIESIIWYLPHAACQIIMCTHVFACLDGGRWASSVLISESHYNILEFELQVNDIVCSSDYNIVTEYDETQIKRAFLMERKL